MSVPSAGAGPSGSKALRRREAGSR
jgi:hypothetical protein